MERPCVWITFKRLESLDLTGFSGIFAPGNPDDLIHVIHFIRNRILLFSTTFLAIYNPSRIRYNVVRTVLF